jgi:hypothetical protein
VLDAEASVVTTRFNTWIIGMSTALAAAILLLTLVLVDRVDEAKSQPKQPVQPTQPAQGSVLSGEQAVAADRAAQSDLRNALVAAKTIQVDENSYASADSSASGLVSVEPSLCYVGSGSASVASGAVCESGVGDASVSVFASARGWAGARMSASGTCFWIADDASGVRYGTGTSCSGTAATGASGPGW